MKIVLRSITIVLTVLIGLYACESFYSDGKLFRTLYHSLFVNQVAKIEILNFEGAQIKPVNPTEDIKVEYPFACIDGADNCVSMDVPAPKKWKTVDVAFDVVHTGKTKIVLTSSKNDDKDPVYVNYRHFKSEQIGHFPEEKTVSHKVLQQMSFQSVQGERVRFQVDVRQYAFRLKDIFYWSGFDVWRFMSVLFGALILWLLLFYLFRFFYCRFQIPQSEMIFVFVSLLLLVFPTFYIRQDISSVKEKRALAEFPSWTANGRLNTKFGVEFNTWFSDRFLGRESMIRLYEIGLTLINGKTLTEIIGKNGWHFDRDIDTYTNKTLFSDSSLESITAYFRAIDEWCRARGKYFLILIAPDKHRIYPEHYPDGILKIRPDFESRANQLVNYIKSHSQVEILYPVEELKAHKKDGMLYYQKNMHWTDLGGYYAYLLTVDNISRNFISLPDISMENVGLTEKISEQVKKQHLSEEDGFAYFVNYDLTYAGFSCDKSVKGNEYTKCINPSRSLTVYFIRDSLLSPMLAYYNDTFGTMYLKDKWDYQIARKDFEDMEKSDIVMMIILEKNLPYLQPLIFQEVQ